jgi:choline dehydrogenase
MLRTWTCLASACILPEVIASTGAPIPTFDYVIVGGGTAGLVVANRLSALPNVSVAIIEVGGDQRQNPNITSANGFSLAFDTPVDWAYRSVPQASSGDRVIEYHAGKAIGGTSTINGTCSDLLVRITV